MKLHQLQNTMKQKGIDACLFFNTSLSKTDPSLQYFSDISLEYGMTCITPKDAWLCVPLMEMERAKASPLREKRIKEKLFEQLPAARTIGLNTCAVSLFERGRLRKATKARFVDVSRIVEKLRMTKTEAELSRIRKACKITDTIYARLFDKRYQTEGQLKARIIKEIYEAGCTPSFEPIVASGSHAGLPHYDGSTALRNGTVIIDFGVRYKGYCSDMTRTCYHGNVSAQVKKLHTKICTLLQDSLSQMKPGERASTQAERVKKQLGKPFLHSLGHGIGVEVHESPRLAPKSKDVLEKNMVLAVEPGYYTKNFGIRVEDDLVVGGKRLTFSPWEMVKI
ncbi:MAG: Xaa-Pro peptidase family protein [Nanoarchaeota archaeon]